jgi:hypothetical protein
MIESACNANYLTRDEFQKELEALAVRQPSAALRALMTLPWEKWAPHLRADACRRLGVEPVVMFRKVEEAPR